KGISLIINLIILFISLGTLIVNEITVSNNSFLGFLLLLYSLFNVVWTLFEKYKEIKSFTGDDKKIVMKRKNVLIKDDDTVYLSKLSSKSQENSQMENYSTDNSIDNSVIWDRKLNRYLWNNEIELKIDYNKKKKVRNFILKNREIITPFFQYKYYNSKKNNQLFFNETKLCMSSDINSLRSYVKCYQGNYFNSFLTNEISTSVLKRKEDATIIYDASNFFPIKYNHVDNSYSLQSIDMCEMSNHIGVSTLAITSDYYLVIRKQGASSQQNINQFVPTGSGSCNWSDITNKSLNETIKYAMLRELWEENGGKKVYPEFEKYGTTKILGYFRWLQRAGKPEFVGITKLNCSLDMLTPDEIELIDTTNKAVKDSYYLESWDDLPTIITEIEQIGNLSVPLHMCLKALKQYYNDRGMNLREFIEGV